MLDPETFLTELSVFVDDFTQERLPVARPHPGPRAGLTRSELLTLALFGQWARFRTERDFAADAAAHLRPAFPGLPSRSRCNRLLRQARDPLTQFALALGADLAAADRSYEILDRTGVRTRNGKRRHHGWLLGLTDLGWCTRLGWYHGCHLLTAVNPTGVITGFGCGPASSNDRHLAETFFQVRAVPDARLLSPGHPVSDCSVADMGFGGQDCQARWATAHEARVICAPQPGSRRVWPKPRRTWLAGLRQVIETVHDHLLETFRLDRERPHALSGVQARLAAKGGLHNVCIWLNRKLGRPDLAMADLLGW